MYHTKNTRSFYAYIRISVLSNLLEVFIFKTTASLVIIGLSFANPCHLILKHWSTLFGIAGCA